MSSSLIKRVTKPHDRIAEAVAPFRGTELCQAKIKTAYAVHFLITKTICNGYKRLSRSFGLSFGFDSWPQLRERNAVWANSSFYRELVRQRRANDHLRDWLGWLGYAKSLRAMLLILRAGWPAWAAWIFQFQPSFRLLGLPGGLPRERFTLPSGAGLGVAGGVGCGCMAAAAAARSACTVAISYLIMVPIRRNLNLQVPAAMFLATLSRLKNVTFIFSIAASSSSVKSVCSMALVPFLVCIDDEETSVGCDNFLGLVASPSLAWGRSGAAAGWGCASSKPKKRESGDLSGDTTE